MPKEALLERIARRLAREHGLAEQIEAEDGGDKEDAKIAAIEVEPARAPKHPGLTPTGGRSIPRSKVPPGILPPSKAQKAQ